MTSPAKPPATRAAQVGWLALDALLDSFFWLDIGLRAAVFAYLSRDGSLVVSHSRIARQYLLSAAAAVRHPPRRRLRLRRVVACAARVALVLRGA